MIDVSNFFEYWRSFKVRPKEETYCHNCGDYLDRWIKKERDNLGLVIKLSGICKTCGHRICCKTCQFDSFRCSFCKHYHTKCRLDCVPLSCSNCRQFICKRNKYSVYNCKRCDTFYCNNCLCSTCERCDECLKYVSKHCITYLTDKQNLQICKNCFEQIKSSN